MLLEILSNYVRETASLYSQMAFWLLLGFALAGVLYLVIPKSAVIRYLGNESLGAAWKASLLGVPIPLCSCGVIPTAMGLRKQGASRAATVSFLISTPQTGVDSIAVTYSFLGPIFALFRPVAAFISGVIGGALVTLFGKEQPKDEFPVEAASSSESLLAHERHMRGLPLRAKLRKMIHYAFVDLLGDIAFWLVVGLLIAGAIALLIPDNFFAERIGAGLPSMLLLMIAGIPLYVCATASVPIAAVLILKGVSAGAAFVFLMTGPATNAATMMVIGRVLGKRILAFYLTTIAILSLLLGLTLNVLLKWTGTEQTITGHIHGEMLPIWLQLGAAILLGALILRHFVRVWGRRLAAPKYEAGAKMLAIFGMHCSHCVESVQAALSSVRGVEKVEVNLERGTAIVEGTNVRNEDLKEAVEGVGYKVGS
ncbi:MAG: SO_0444 family Cu/Zn efflux transporter [bacterium]